MRSGANQVRRAFTLIELLVVIGIIAVLVGIGLSVGLGVINSSRSNTTKNTIQVLETYLAELDAAGKEPKSYRSFKTEVGGQSYEFPVVDGRDRSQGVDATVRPISSLMRFIAAGETFLGDSSATWAALDSSVVRDGSIGMAGTEEIRGVELTDQWGNPIRVVHPAYDGGYGEFWNPTTESMVNGSRPTDISVTYASGGSNQMLRLRRSYRPFNPGTNPNGVGDADEGICSGERVYFYSAGPDGDPGTREDNVYTVRPKFPAETEDFE